MEKTRIKNRPFKISENISLIEEPLNEIKDKIKDSEKIILSGNRGSGLTTVLSYLSEKEDSVMIKIDDIFNKYYRTNYCAELLKAIIFSQLYEKISDIDICKADSFALGKMKANLVLENFAYSINSNKPIEVDKIKMFDVDAKEIVKSVKQKFGFKSLTLMIDRFDWILGSNHQLQLCLAPYMDIFDRTIITTNDKKVLNGSREKELNYKGFHIETVVYSKNYEIFLKLIDAFIEIYPNKLYDEFVCDLGMKDILINITEEDKRWLFNQYSGNIKNLFFTLERYVVYKGSQEIKKKAQRPIDLAYAEVMKMLTNPLYSEIAEMYMGEKIYDKNFTLHL